MRWVWAILLAAFLIALMPFLQAFLEWRHIVPASRDESWFHAFAIIVIVLLCVLIFRRPTSRPTLRMVRPRGRQDED